MNYYITLKEIPSRTEGVTGIPKGVLVKGGWDTEDSYFRVQLAPFRRVLNQAYSATILPDTARACLREVSDSEIEKGLKAIGLLEADNKEGTAR